MILDQPWYKTVRNKRKRDDEEDDDNEVDLKRKHRLDPMTQVTEMLKEKDKSKKHKKDHHDFEKQKHAKKKGDEKEKPKQSQTKTIEQLRAERLKRESEERIKAQRLMLGIKETPSNEPKVEADDRKRRYNNQFNPDFSKY